MFRRDSDWDAQWSEYANTINFSAEHDDRETEIKVRGEIMREGIHPEYFQAKVVCNCGNEFVTGSVKPELHVEICSKCHPFYTGQQKLTNARGRIDKFNRKYGVNA